MERTWRNRRANYEVWGVGWESHPGHSQNEAQQLNYYSCLSPCKSEQALASVDIVNNPPTSSETHAEKMVVCRRQGMGPAAGTPSPLCS